MNRKLFALTGALALSTMLSGCGIFGGGDSKKAKTPVLGQRIAVLTAETGVEVDPTLEVVPVTVPVEQVNPEWSQSGGNAAKAMGHLALGQQLGVAWNRSISGSSSKKRLGAGPVVGAGRVYVMDVDATIHAFDLKSGAPVWTATLGDKDGNRDSLFGGGVSYADGKVYAANGVGDAAAFDAGTGSQLWKVRPGGPLRGAPSVGSDAVYVMSQDNQLFALKEANGEQIWNASGSLENAAVFGAAAPAIGQGTVVAGFSSGELNAYRYENGRPVWQDSLSRTSITTSVASLVDIDASPVIDQGRVYAVGQGGRMVAMDILTGQRLWELNIAGIETPWVAGEWLFVVTDDAKIMCIARNSGRIRWQTQLSRYKDVKKRNKPIGWSGPVLAGGRLIVTNTLGQIVNVSIDDGKIGTITKLGDTIYQAPVVADNTLLVLTDKGKLVAYR
ncbi:PQQ-binding-like beta-propeller repeat protein [Sphingomonadaceae bacterium G21617-S1]|jgi:outer membrane protein assembly factor BamB|uniref:PQQ-like beta-propeller repeat protein n=1 Tax=Rhizorhabdus sp. TaxID=1968843 RepID=UPI00121F8FA3|nr:PQQ-like beta-propeller repeat protein [Rhizorhabdus sp.]MBD3762152.1 PQQ-binding-like beta-propeller repeat protein [Rhizorhabdus sp.]MCZ4340243.1 PQQ-binding-like beta-propeller repeat protein [Sphingomonadaceae bacterium G21617-S1]TAK08732.1 MAG: pyrrolo-quinoline quinone [Rhizorhabdus sp.]